MLNSSLKPRIDFSRLFVCTAFTLLASHSGSVLLNSLHLQVGDVALAVEPEVNFAVFSVKDTQFLVDLLLVVCNED